ncbi:CHAT domain-containing protein [Nostoc sp.]|uniref:CHAT domain-containing protein n=1 Tax=Nostoc sp. TaxID=1180 RepID=UPI002FF95EC3
MSKNKASLNMRLQMLLRRLKKLCQKPPLMLAALLFVISMAIPPVVAQVPEVTTSVQSQQVVFGLIKQGRTLYQEGNYQQAAEVLEQAADTFKMQGNKVNQAMALSNLSLIYQQLGKWDDAKDSISTSLNVLQSQPKTQESLRIYAQTLDIQGKLKLNIGQSAEALETWQQATKIYAQISDKDGVAQSQINQAQAMQDLGLYPRACNTLINALDIDIEKIGKGLKLNIQDCHSLTKLNTNDLNNFTEKLLMSLNQEPNSHSQLKIDGLRSLGEVFQVVVGNENLSTKLFLESQNIAQRLNSLQDISANYLSLGNIKKAFAKRQDRGWLSRNVTNALDDYDHSANLTKLASTRVLAQVNSLSLSLEEKRNWSKAEKFWLSLQPEIEKLPVSKIKVYAQINVAHSFIQVKNSKDFSTENNLNFPNFEQIEQILTKAAEQSNNLGDKRAEASAIGNRGWLYEQAKQWEKAKQFTDEALNIVANYSDFSNRYQHADITYPLNHQLGRIIKNMGDIEGAINAYEKAVNSLQLLRNDLVSVSPDIQFNFRDKIEPIYNELVDLYLYFSKTAKENANKQDSLEKARNVIESLQLAELNNFFRDVCIQEKDINIDEIVDKAKLPTAIIYTILRDNHLDVILKLPQNKFLAKEKTINLSSDDMESIEDLLKLLQNKNLDDESISDIKSEINEIKFISQKLYNWLIRPIETQLTNNGIKTLVFVLDDVLRSIPMAVLHDGKQYLIEKYAIAVTPGLKLLKPRPFAEVELKALTAGLSQGTDVPPLPNVPTELNQIKNAGFASIELLNEKFTKNNLRDKIKNSSFPVIHLATHAQFSSQAEDTYILTSDGKLNIKEFANLFQRTNQNQSKLELLVLSACETASGNNRAILGLAGIAVRAGAGSTVGTLWKVSDDSTATIMGHFYEQLAHAKTTKVTKAEALHLAQVKLLEQGRSQQSKYEHPFYWAPFILVGNWQ